MEVKTGYWYIRKSKQNDSYIHKDIVFFRNLDWDDQDSMMWHIDTNGGESKVTAWFELDSYGSVPTEGLIKLDIDYTEYLKNACQETGLPLRELFRAVFRYTTYRNRHPPSDRH
jgi:hypothetical protein